jgi:hypothetical protein
MSIIKTSEMSDGKDYLAFTAQCGEVTVEFYIPYRWKVKGKFPIDDDGFPVQKYVKLYLFVNSSIRRIVHPYIGHNEQSDCAQDLLLEAYPDAKITVINTFVDDQEICYD